MLLVYYGEHPGRSELWSGFTADKAGISLQDRLCLDHLCFSVHRCLHSLDAG